MSDSFGFTLHSPLTKEDWNKIADVEHEKTMSVTFQTPQGRQVRYIKCEVLDEIRAEIKAKYDSIPWRNNDYDDGWVEALEWVFDDVIDKYKAESEEE